MLYKLQRNLDEISMLHWSPEQKFFHLFLCLFLFWQKENLLCIIQNSANELKTLPLEFPNERSTGLGEHAMLNEHILSSWRRWKKKKEREIFVMSIPFLLFTIPISFLPHLFHLLSLPPLTHSSRPHESKIMELADRNGNV